MAKNLRRNCDNVQCGKLYRYKSAASKYCNVLCRNAAARGRKIAKEKAESDARWAMLREQARQIDAQIAKSEPDQDDEEPPTPVPAPRPKPPKPKPINKLFPPPKEEPTRITIRNVPTTFPGTALPRGYR